MKSKLFMITTIVLAMLMQSVQATDLNKIRLPEGFSIEIWVDGVENARQMALGDQGTLFVGSRRAGKVHAITDTDGDGRHDQVRLIASKLNLPSGLTFHQGDLYVAEVDTIWRYRDIEQHIGNPPEPEKVYDDLPDDKHHGWKYIKFGPGGQLYIPVGAPCNICDEEGYATIRRVDLTTGKHEIVAQGVRNSVGFDFHPETGELWFTDNGRDWMGDDLPDCELNRVSEVGQHFGYPYVHQGDVLDPEFGDGRNPDDYVAPVANLGPHVAPLGMLFYTGQAFPAEYQGAILIAEHGSWNRSKKIGYRLRHAIIRDDGSLEKLNIFAEGWLQGEEAWGRPVDIIQMDDGSILVSDDAANQIYRISYKG